MWKEKRLVLGERFQLYVENESHGTHIYIYIEIERILLHSNDPVSTEARKVQMRHLLLLLSPLNRSHRGAAVQTERRGIVEPVFRTVGRGKEALAVWLWTTY